ncbi:MAG: hypothetical protein CM15mP83_4180 [Flavobacteriaceae bacterium]|nr:MAG: hypothetical protein CM15mP83_4180 [Flavobacteriaceae bacterium]
MKEKKDRVDDALHATRAAVEEGIVSGGGVALLNARKSIQKSKLKTLTSATGNQIVFNAVEAPLRTIVTNAGGEGLLLYPKSKKAKPILAMMPNRKLMWICKTLESLIPKKSHVLL